MCLRKDFLIHAYICAILENFKPRYIYKDEDKSDYTLTTFVSNKFYFSLLFNFFPTLFPILFLATNKNAMKIFKEKDLKNS